jgi:phosphatidylglycerophosphatase A
VSGAGLKAAAVSVLGLGHMRPASGTWGSTPPVAVAFALVWLGAAPRIVDLVLIIMGVAAAVACLRFGAWAQERYGRVDPRQVVADEVAGQCVALLALPWRDGPDALAWNVALAATAFFAFRILDIVKPPPARAAERLPAGHGILADDLVAGVYALIVTQLAAWVLWPQLIG